MNYPVDSAAQLRRVLQALRQSRHLSHTALAERLGTSRQQVESVETAPETARFDEVARVLEAMGCRLTIEEIAPPTPLTRPNGRALHEIGG